MSSTSTNNTLNPIPLKCPELITNIQVNPLTNRPDDAWESASIKVNKEQCDRLPLDLPIFENKV